MFSFFFLFVVVVREPFNFIAASASIRSFNQYKQSTCIASNDFFILYISLVCVGACVCPCECVAHWYVLCKNNFMIQFSRTCTSVANCYQPVRAYHSSIFSIYIIDCNGDCTEVAHWTQTHTCTHYKYE